MDVLPTLLHLISVVTSMSFNHSFSRVHFILNTLALTAGEVAALQSHHLDCPSGIQGDLTLTENYKYG